MIKEIIRSIEFFDNDENKKETNMFKKVISIEFFDNDENKKETKIVNITSSKEFPNNMSELILQALKEYDYTNRIINSDEDKEFEDNKYSNKNTNFTLDEIKQLAKIFSYDFSIETSLCYVSTKYNWKYEIIKPDYNFVINY